MTELKKRNYINQLNKFTRKEIVDYLKEVIERKEEIDFLLNSALSILLAQILD